MKHQKIVAGWLYAGLLALVSTPLLAQTAPSDSATDQNREQVVQMSQFIVRTTSGMGYVDANSASGFKTSQNLLDIPQTELVITQDLMRDIGIPSRYTTDMMQYAGVATWFRGGTQGAMIRGSRAATNLSDGLVGASYWNQDFIDSLEVLKGTIAVLYQGSATTGSVIESTKKPLKIQQTIFDLTGTTNGGFTAAFDTTGPLGNIGDVKVTYRVLGGLNSNGNWFNNDQMNVKDIHPSIEMDYKNTTWLLAYGVEQIRGTWNGNGILTPSGDLYTGQGYRDSGNWFPGLDKVTGLHRDLRTIFLTKISDSWENKISAIYWTETEYGGNAVITSENWQTHTFGGIFRQNNEPVNFTQILDDVTGKYTFFGIPFQTTAGFAHSEREDTSKFWTTVNDGPNTFTVPIGSAAAINAVHVPQQQAGEYNVPAVPGSRSLGYSELVYAQEQVDILPNLLSLVGGWAYVKTESISDTNIGINTPYPSTDIGFHVWVPRWGVVAHVTKDISLYALDSQSASLNNSLDYFNNRLPNVQIVSKEVGMKTDLYQGKLVVDFAVFRTVQTNQAVFSGLTNPQGVGYYLNVGTTTNEGWDSSIAMAPLPGLQVIATGYVGTVKNQANVWVSPGFGNMLTLFFKYDLPKESVLKSLSLGGGFSRVGSRYITTGGETFPVGYPTVAFFKMHEGTQATAFVDYKITKNFSAHLSVLNLLDQKYPMGSQSPGVIDPAVPRDFQLTITTKF